MKGKLFVLMGVVQAAQCVAIAILYSRYSFVDPDLYDIVKAQNSLDVFHVASQIGRFDLISTLLTAWGLFIGFAALGGFWTIRSAAVAASEATTRAYIEENAKRLFGEVATTRQGPAPRQGELGLTPAEQEAAIESAQEMRPGDV